MKDKGFVLTLYTLWFVVKARALAEIYLAVISFAYIIIFLYIRCQRDSTKRYSDWSSHMGVELQI